jgi:hypothetical protein
VHTRCKSMGNAFGPPQGRAYEPYMGQGQPRTRTAPYAQGQHAGHIMITPQFWEQRGLRWEQGTTRCNIVTPFLTFGRPPGPWGTERDWFQFAKQVFETMCGIIRTRAYEMNQNSHPENRDLYHHFAFTLNPSQAKWQEVLRKVGAVLDQMQWTYDSPSNHGHHGGMDVEWRVNASNTEFTCVIHRFPADVFEPELQRLMPRDKAIQKYFERIQDFEFNELVKEEKLNASARMSNVKFVYDGEPVVDGVNVVEDLKKWNAMRKANAILAPQNQQQFPVNESQTHMAPVQRQERPYAHPLAPPARIRGPYNGVYGRAPLTLLSPEQEQQRAMEMHQGALQRTMQGPAVHYVTPWGASNHLLVEHGRGQYMGAMNYGGILV